MKDSTKTTIQDILRIIKDILDLITKGLSEKEACEKVSQKYNMPVASVINIFKNRK